MLGGWQILTELQIRVNQLYNMNDTEGINPVWIEEGRGGRGSTDKQRGSCGLVL